MEKKYRLFFNIPNFLSLLRLILIPVFVHTYCCSGAGTLSFVILLISGITDILDGHIARKFNMVSSFGKVLDPVADKLTQIVTLFCLTGKYPVMLLALTVLCVKESLAALLCILAIRKSGRIQSSLWHGKLNTVILYALMSVHLLWQDIPNFISFLLVSVSSLTMLFSFALYTLENLMVLIKKNKLH